MTAQVSLLLGVYLVLKAMAYWLDRFAQVWSSRGPVTGVSYTVANAVLPGKVVLIVIAAICAVVLFVNVALRTSRLLVGGLAVMAVGAFIFGVAWPGILQQFREKPSASHLELPSIATNIKNTDEAFSLTNQLATTRGYGQLQLSRQELADQVRQNAQVRLLDPNQFSPTFTVQQQKEAYYGFKSTLDIDRYEINGRPRDVAIAVRELNTGAIPRKTWANLHLVYTHGYGVVAAPTDSLTGGTPNYLDGGIPQRGRIPVTTPQIYYGQMSPSYSIVGQPKGSTTNLEVDHPSTNGSSQQVNTTHQGGGGVPIGSFLHRLIYAYKLHSTGVLFSSEINSASQLLTVRNPRARVAAVAPWLTLDGDTYPTIVNGRVLWVVDGYTTTNNVPDSQQINLHSATSNTLTTSSGATVSQPNTSINYIRNSVKATVDAYTGQVTLYEWNQVKTADTPDPQPDPILKTWEKAFPGLVKHQSDIPADLLPHLRYPQDLFNVQRSLLTRYHESIASQFYNGSDFWQIPNDPTAGARESAHVDRQDRQHRSAHPAVDVHVDLGGRREPGDLRPVDAHGDPERQQPGGVPVGRLPARSRLRPVHAARGAGRLLAAQPLAGAERHRVELPRRALPDAVPARQLEGHPRQPALDAAGWSGAVRRADLHPGQVRQHLPDVATGRRGLRQQQGRLRVDPEGRVAPGTRPADAGADATDDFDPDDVDPDHPGDSLRHALTVALTVCLRRGRYGPGHACR